MEGAKNNNNSAAEEIKSEYKDTSATESVSSKDMKSAASHAEPVNMAIVFLRKQNETFLSKLEEVLAKHTTLEGLINSLQATIGSLACVSIWE